MATFRDPKALLRAQGARFARIQADLEIEHEALAKDMKSEAIGLTSGTVSTSTLERLGHPFGRRASGRKRGRLPTLPINKQSGKLRAGFRIYKISLQGITHRDVMNIVPYAKYVLAIGGSTRVVARGFYRELRKIWKNRNFELLKRMRASQTK